MDLKATVTAHMKEAMKAGDSVKLGVVRMLLAEIKKREIDKRAPLEEAEIQKAIQQMMKQRNDSVEAFTKGNRPDLADKEKAENEYLKGYLPQMLSATEVEALVVAAIAETGASTPQDIGKVMKAAVAKAGGRADGKLVNEIARAKLSKA